MIYLTFPYIGYQGESVVQKCTKRLSKLMKREKKVVFKVFLETTKLAFFTSNKDKIPFLSSSGVVYEYSCPGCAKSYVGKTNNTLFNRTSQHGWTQKDSSIFKHFGTCPEWQELVGFLQIGGDIEVDRKELQILTVRENTKVVASARNFLKLDFRESIEIKHRKPELNKGLKSCKDLALF